MTHELNVMKSHMMAAEGEAERAVGELKLKVADLEDQLEAAHAIGKKLVREKHELMRQNAYLVERVLQLEGTPVQLTKEEQERIEAFIAEVRSFCTREPASAGGAA